MPWNGNTFVRIDHRLYQIYEMFHYYPTSSIYYRALNSCPDGRLLWPRPLNVNLSRMDHHNMPPSVCYTPIAITHHWHGSFYQNLKKYDARLVSDSYIESNFGPLNVQYHSQGWLVEELEDVIFTESKKCAAVFRREIAWREYLCYELFRSILG